MNIYQKIISAAQRNPAAPAFISAQGYLTYGQFISLIAFASQELHRQGVVKGDVVGVMLSHIPLHAAVVVAIAQLGGISISLNQDIPAPEMAKRVKRFSVKYLVRTADIPPAIGVKNIEFTKINFGAGQYHFDLSKEGLPEPKSDDPARFLLTSGSTGDGQAILHTQQSWVERVNKTVDGIESSSRIVLPDIYSTLGNIFLLGTLFSGAALIVNRRATILELITDINTYAATHLIFPPYIFQRMLEHIPEKGIAFPTVQHLRPVGSSLSKPLLDALLTRVSPNVYYPYGISEVGAISIATPAMLKKYPRTSGKIKSWSKAEIVDENEMIVKAGEIGQIRVKVEGMTNQYYEAPDVSKAKFRDGWFYSSDHGYINEEGLLFIQGRMDDLINLDGKKLFPTQLEEQIINTSHIADCAFFTIKAKEVDQLFGAFVASRHDIDRALANHPHLKSLLGDRYFSVASLPRNTNGKILRKDLVSIFSKEISEISKT
ncbi:class I adenylate-forming enzyme family protein [Polynucleobacter sp. JS-JIR-II-b4]|uniref:class I adenylate-forming enzyme family protein n=1 Tax=Polynucleobacter sp. JS-JIR-II-b4 TaxID=1758390 RepID=UPI001BFE1D3A|nr:fatty acid--CoA ligase family protein [Polynucleobacter sp. JS-JIR-II-b4]QWE02865.1 long-chain fatty acid--CoA ligase [Polynucleobacter sp. JS-JIR-II-b4]